MQGLNLKCGLALVVMPWALLLAGASCDTCVQLSNLVCDCEPSANAQIACRQQRELQRSQRDEERKFRAGARAFIQVDGELTSSQEEQIRALTALLRSILKINK